MQIEIIPDINEPNYNANIVSTLTLLATDSSMQRRERRKGEEICGY